MTSTVTFESEAEAQAIQTAIPGEGSRAWPRPAYAWYVLVILLVAYAFAIVDRTTIGLLVDPIKHDLHINDSQIGLLQGLAFAICYTTFGIPLGYLADRAKRTPLLAAGIAFWSAATVACGLAMNFVVLFAARIGVGIGEATVTPGSGSLIADYFPPEKRGRAYGVWMLGSSLGAGIASLAAAAALVIADRLIASHSPLAAHLHTWQITFLLIGAPGLVVSLLFMLTVREPVRRGRHVSVEGFTLKPLLQTLSSNRKAYAALMGGAVMNVTTIYAQLGWLPSVYMRVHHWSPAKVASITSVFTLPLSVSGAVLGGWLMSWLTKKGRSDAPILAAMSHSAFTLVFGVAACLAPRAEMTLAFAAVAGITSTWSYSGAMTGLNQITPNELRGQISALYTLFTGLVSMTLGAFSVGFLNDMVFQGRAGVAPSLATVYAVGSVIALAVLAFGRKSYAVAERSSRTEEARLR